MRYRKTHTQFKKSHTPTPQLTPLSTPDPTYLFLYPHTSHPTLSHYTSPHGGLCHKIAHTKLYTSVTISLHPS